MKPTDFFDLQAFAHKELFGDELPWQAVRALDSYIKQQFDSGVVVENCEQFPGVYIGEGTTIAPGAVIEGPAIIGRGCTIGHGAYIRGGCILGDRVHVGHAAELKHVILMNDVAVAHLNYIGDSILGHGVNISGGAVCANFRLDKKPVVVKNGDERIDTGLEKLGAIIGDGSNIGVNTVLNPGTLLGKATVVYPLQSVSGTHPAEAVVR